MKKTPGNFLNNLNKLPVLALFALLTAPAQAQIEKVVNGASFVRNRSLTPGSIISILGRNLTNTTAYATNPLSLPASLGGVSVAVAGLTCPLFYVSPTQVNAQLHPGVPLGAATLTLTSPTGTFTAAITVEKAGLPGLFSLSGSGTRDGAILNAVTFERGPFSVTTGGGPTYLAIYATGLDLSSTAAPVVRIDGVQAPVLYWGPAPGFVGLQQINVQVPPSLAGAGRVEVAVTAGGKTSNIVEVVILPSPGQGPFAPQFEHKQRNRELASMAYVPGTSYVLLTDENDDVVRVIDVRRREVVRTLALPEGAEPVAVAVDPVRKLAIVAERDRERVAILDVADPLAARVLSEVPVGKGPGSVAVAGAQALVVNQDSGNVSILNLDSRSVTATLAVGAGPRSVAYNPATTLAYVTNQNDGTISVIALAGVPTINKTLDLGENARPRSIQIMSGLGIAVVTEPSSREDGKVVLLDAISGTLIAEINVNPDKSGGASDIAVWERSNTVYFANQSGGSITIVEVTPARPLPTVKTSTLKVDLGARALAIDTLDEILLVSNQGSGTVVLVDLKTNTIIGRINAVRSPGERDDDWRDDRDDRDRAPNLPTITSLNPAQRAAGPPPFTLTITGTNLTGATGVLFIDPDTLPGKGKGMEKREEHGNHGHGPFGKPDQAFTVSNISVNTAGTQLSALVSIAAGASKGERIVRVQTPNGESTFRETAVNVFRVQ